MLVQDEILDAEEVAKLLKINERTVKRLANTGELQGFQIGGRWRFQRSDIETYIEDQKRKQQQRQE